VRTTYRSWFAVTCRSAVVLAVAVAVTAIAAPGARAAFPGANGRIAFTVSEIKLDVGPPPHPAYTYTVWSKIETVLPTGRGLRSLRACPAAGCADSAPAWSPDGKHLAFITGESESPLAIVKQNGTGLRHIEITSPGVTPIPAAASDSSIVWSPNGRRVVFVGGVFPMEIPQLFTVGLDGSGLRQVTNLCSDEPTWSVRGTIAFRGACQEPATGIYTIRPNGSQLYHVLHNRYWPPTYPDWSPNGTKLAYTGAVSDAQTNIYICDASGQRAHQLTQHGGSQPVWSPDGKYIAFINNNGLYVIERNGHGLRRIASVPPVSPYTTSTTWLVLSSPSWQSLPR